MRRLLHSLGLDEEFLDLYSKATNAASVLTHPEFASNPVLGNITQDHAFGVSEASTVCSNGAPYNPFDGANELG